MNKQLLLQDLADLEQSPPNAFVCEIFNDPVTGCNCIFGEISNRLAPKAEPSLFLRERYSDDGMINLFLSADSCIRNNPDHPRKAIVEFYDWCEENITNA